MRSNPRLGTAFHISISSGNLILRAESDVRIGDDVFDGNGRRVGTVFDILGPVSSPYVAVKPRIEAAERYVGEPLFSVMKRR